MNKNVKSIFFVLTLVTLLLAVGAVCAADDADSTSATDSSASDAATISETASNSVATEPITTTSNKNINTENVKISNNSKLSIKLDENTEAKTHILTNDSVTEIFSKNGTSPYAGFGFNSSLLGDNINDGDTIDIQGNITGNYNLTINKKSQHHIINP